TTSVYTQSENAVERLRNRAASKDDYPDGGIPRSSNGTMTGAPDWIVDLCDFAVRGLQAGCDIAQDFVIIGGGGAFYVNASAFDSGLFHQSFEVELNEVFNLLSRKERDGNTGRLAG